MSSQSPPRLDSFQSRQEVGDIAVSSEGYARTRLAEGETRLGLARTLRRAGHVGALVAPAQPPMHLALVQLVTPSENPPDLKRLLPYVRVYSRYRAV